MRFTSLFFLICSALVAQNSPCDGNYEMISQNQEIICVGDSISVFPQVTDLDSFAWFDGSHQIPRVFSTSGSYSIQGFITIDDLIVNGDFENSTTGFTSDYTNNQTTIWNEGTYAITADVSIQHPNLVSNGNGGTGSFMAVNGTGAINTEVWCQTVTVLPNTNYEFSAWVTSTHTTNPAILQFRVNGTLLSTPFSAAPTVNTWNEFFAVWNSGTNTSVEICIVNQNTSLSGNDFGIDDISFFRQCDSTTLIDSFNLTVLPYADATIIDPEPVCVSSTSEQLFGVTQGGSWSGTGVTNQGLGFFNPSNAGVGLHEITYTFNNPCGDEQKAFIEVFPDVQLGVDTAICEISPEFELLVQSDTTGQWIGVGVDADGVFYPDQTGPGNHQIIFSNSVCEDDMNIRVDEMPILTIPLLEACEGLEPVIFSFDSVYDSYVWSDGTETVYKEIDVPGVYTLTIRNGECVRDFEFDIINSCTPNVFIPNIFTPDNDGLNESFFPIINGVDENNMDLKIFDRWGKQVFQSKSKNNPWFGYDLNGDKVSTGNYVYIFTYGYFVKGKYYNKIDEGIINLTY